MPPGQSGGAPARLHPRPRSCETEVTVILPTYSYVPELVATVSHKRRTTCSLNSVYCGHGDVTLHCSAQTDVTCVLTILCGINRPFPAETLLCPSVHCLYHPKAGHY